MWYMPRKQLIAYLSALALTVVAFVAVAVPASYDRVIGYVFLHEGGWFNHPNDPGGCTMYGITIHDVRRYVRPGATCTDVRRLTRAQAGEIYRKRYWDEVRGDDLGAGLDYTVMDLGVNSGVGRARSFTRRAIGLNGVMTRFTDREIELIQEACAADNCVRLIRNINSQRSRFVHALRTCAHFCRGWDRRIAHVLRESLAMSGGVAGAELGRPIAPMRTYGRAIERAEDLNPEGE